MMPEDKKRRPVRSKTSPIPKPGKSSERTVALTGADSFIGRKLIKRLESDPAYQKIVALDVRLPDVQMGNKTQYFKVDLTETTSDQEIAEILTREGADTVVHLAFLASPTHNQSWAHELESVGTMHVLNACAECFIKKIITWSHTCVYGAYSSNPSFLTESHPLKGDARSRFIRDKVEVEEQIKKYRERNPRTTITVLRTCSILGPTVKNYVSRYFSRRLTPMLMGFDPLMQFVHEDDVIDAFKLALDRNFSNDYNIVGDGVMHLSTILKIAGRIPIPVPRQLAFPLANFLWTAQITEAPPHFLNFLRFQWIADGRRAREEMRFVPRYSTQETIYSFLRSKQLGASSSDASPK